MLFSIRHIWIAANIKLMSWMLGSINWYLLSQTSVHQIWIEHYANEPKVPAVWLVQLKLHRYLLVAGSSPIYRSITSSMTSYKRGTDLEMTPWTTALLWRMSLGMASRTSFFVRPVKTGIRKRTSETRFWWRSRTFSVSSTVGCSKKEDQIFAGCEEAKTFVS